MNLNELYTQIITENSRSKHRNQCLNLRRGMQLQTNDIIQSHTPRLEITFCL